MTDREMIEKLTEFIGWQFTDDVQVIGEHKFREMTSIIWYRRPDGGISIVKSGCTINFDPLRDPIACALVLDEIERWGWYWQWTYDLGITSFIIFRRLDDDESIREHGKANSDNRYRAVCLAVLDVMNKAEAKMGD